MNSSDIAKLANVSRSTVSRVINNYKNVPESTRKKVQEIIDKYGYTPNLSARSLAGKANNIIGIFIGDFEKKSSKDSPGDNSPYHAELVIRIVQECKKRKYMALVNSISTKEELTQISQCFDNNLIYGGVFIGFPYHMKELETLALKNYNVVLIDQMKFEDDEKFEINLINSNNFLGGYEITKYLIENGHKEIAHLEGDNRLSSFERREGYLSALKDYGIERKDCLIKCGNFKEEKAYLATKEILKNNRPTAIFAANDVMALGASRAIKELGLNIPEDISIIGFDNLKFWETLSFENQEFLLSLTTMEIDMKDLANKTILSLFSKNKKEHKYCSPKLIKKKTVLKK